MNYNYSYENTVQEMRLKRSKSRFHNIKSGETEKSQYKHVKLLITKKKTGEFFLNP